ncbi:MAG: ATPase [Spirochaetaceae bacterium]|jgi:hypothetical protein|nr:ATPase [Spirochaetaceae bacterium]
MEELRSTEILDREILEDARKKAYRILKAADDTVTSSAESWEKKTERALAGVRKKYAERSAKAREEIMARLPLDKRRARSEYFEGCLKSAMDAYLSGLKRDTLLALLEAELAVRFAEYRETGEDPAPVPWRACFRGLHEAEAAALLKKLAPRPFDLQGDGLFDLAGTFPAVVVNTPSARIIASVDAAAGALLDDRRGELVSALIGAEALND